MLMDLASSFVTVGYWECDDLKDMEDCTACPDAELAERAVLYLAGQKSADDVTGSPWLSSLARILDGRDSCFSMFCFKI